MGFNMLRKHVKTECRRWYYHCDRLGILVMQDMPSGGIYDYKWQTVMPTIGFKQEDHDNPKLGRTDPRAQKIYYDELDEMLDNLYNCTSLFACVRSTKAGASLTQLKSPNISGIMTIPD